ncbi:piggyBac transposable element-derived protein 4-like [Zootermopsis nevadensis]|uniref:piggyBac transposable element-derived protein 4-like n=1 Tax=Zootermopsis nevadensis TaxID=136037 RepID=UPI000B8ECDB1|nr:piggyBac transposable element-derived protein 4-like [Zootermopsis nevadensis]
MAGPSTSCAFMELEEIQVLNEVLEDESVSEYTSDDDGVFDNDYTQFVTPGTHVISDSESDNDSEEIQEEIVHVGLGGVSSKFVWENIDSFPASRETFCNVYGPQFDTAGLDVVSSFENIFDVPLVQLIVEPTLKSYYAKNRLLSTPFFPETLPLERLEVINKFMHFVDNSKEHEYQGPPKLFKIYPVIQHLNNKFQNLYLPSQNISIDESLTLWKGRLSFKQYIPLKAAQLGIKTFELCESSSGYVWSFLVYTGKDMELTNQFVTAETSKTAVIVVKLLEPLLGRGHTVWMDNFYNSPHLARFLKSKKTDCVGTLRPNWKNVPPAVKNMKLKKGEHCGQHSGDVAVLAWQDKRRVTMISTYHKHDICVTINTAKQEQTKPVVVRDYNKHMLGVDMKDQMLQPYLLERKRGTKWYMTLFKRLLNVAIHNAMVMYRCVPNNKNIDTLRFRISLAQGLVEKHGPGVPRPVFGRPSLEPPPKRLSERHFPDRIPPTAKKARPQRKCVLCTKHGKRRDSKYWCSKCGAALCIEGCFKNYHTKLNF